MGHVADAGQRVVFAEVAGLGGALADEGRQPFAGRVGDVLVEGARPGGGLEDAADGGVIEGAVALGVAQRGEQVAGRVALAQREDLAGVVGGAPALGALEAAEVGVGAVAERVEGGPQDVEVGAAGALRHVMDHQLQHQGPPLHPNPETSCADDSSDTSGSSGSST